MTLQLWTDGEEFVIAESAEEAIRLYKLHMGSECICGEVPEWGIWKSDKFTLHGEHDVTRTVSEWIKLNGKGYFASSNY